MAGADLITVGRQPTDRGDPGLGRVRARGEILPITASHLALQTYRRDPDQYWAQAHITFHMDERQRFRALHTDHPSMLVAPPREMIGESLGALVPHIATEIERTIERAHSLGAARACVTRDVTTVGGSSAFVSIILPCATKRRSILLVNQVCDEHPLSASE